MKNTPVSFAMSFRPSSRRNLRNGEPLKIVMKFGAEGCLTEICGHGPVFVQLEQQ
jgi:hypothetical protein